MGGWFFAHFQSSETASLEWARTNLGIVKRQLLAQLLGIFAEFCGQGFSASQGILQLPLALIRQSFLSLQRLRVDVLSSFTGLPAKLRQDESILTHLEHSFGHTMIFTRGGSEGNLCLWLFATLSNSNSIIG